MAAEKKPVKKTPQPAPGVLGWLRSAEGRLVLSVLVVLAGATAATAVLWSHVREFVLASPDYRLRVENVQISPAAPAWIKSDVCGEALRNASLDEGPSVLAADLPERMAQAFAAHPWVRQVTAVRLRHPAGAHIDLAWRKPVCMVELPGGGLFPVDAEGVVLPTADFTPEEARGYPRLAEIATVPVGSVGGRWGDPRVAGGATVAEALLKSWQELQLVRIVPSASTDSQDEHTFELCTQAGGKILWGRAAAGDKLARLRASVAGQGMPGSPGAPPEIDLRSEEEGGPPKRTVLLPEAAARQ